MVTEEEQTILDLSREIRARLSVLKNKLDDQFSRIEPDLSKQEDCPQEPSVLDEILGILRNDLAQLNTIIDQLSSSILPKIS
ncbi:hypothetical protein LCGC14_2112100 [marine sediment metagenome]|uniref:Uncharacterized protein n=1 Tax=marine sediment metagenome TaxID=412755 RepID=A0A0F9ETV3_9ZZZZ